MVASSALGQCMPAQALSQFGWVSGAWRCSPEMARGRVEYVHGEGHTLYQPLASCSTWAAERTVEKRWWHTIGKTFCQCGAVLMVGLRRCWYWVASRVVTAAG